MGIKAPSPPPPSPPKGPYDYVASLILETRSPGFKALGSKVWGFRV